MMNTGFLQRLQNVRRRKASMPIGIDFGQDQLHLVQCEQAAEGMAIRAAASLPYPADLAVLQADRKAFQRFVNKALSAAPFEGRRVCSAMPPAHVRIIPLTLQISAGANEAGAVVKALQDKLRSDLSNEVVDYLRIRGLGSPETETNVLVAVAARDQVMNHLRRLEMAGLEPVTLDIGPAALARLLAIIQKEEINDSVMLVNFGAQSSYITVVWGRRLVIDREVEFGETRLVEKLAASLKVDTGAAFAMLRQHGLDSSDAYAGTVGDAGRTIHEILHPEFAALAEEISRTMIYIASRTRGRTPRFMYLNGKLAQYPQMMARMRRLVDIPVEVLNPFDVLQPLHPAAISAETDPTNGIALAAGLALRG